MALEKCFLPLEILEQIIPHCELKTQANIIESCKIVHDLYKKNTTKDENYAISCNNAIKSGPVKYYVTDDLYRKLFIISTKKKNDVFKKVKRRLDNKYEHFDKFYVSQKNGKCFKITRINGGYNIKSCSSEKNRKRTFTIFLNGKQSGRYTGSTPKQAANKAFTAINHKENLKGQRLITDTPVVYRANFIIKETTRGSTHKYYFFEGKRIKLDFPCTRRVGQTQVTWRYKNEIQKRKIAGNYMRIYE